jgi:TolB protein
MKALFVICTLAVLFNLVPLSAQAEDISLPAPITPNGTWMQVNTRAGGQSASSADPGTIAYVRMSTQDIHTISPDGAGDRVLWTNPGLSGMKSVMYLAWRPDGRELAFSSEHEAACSWYDSDVYAISFSGGGYRRVTNSPACAALAGLPKGSVTVNVNNYASDLVWVYVQGAPSVKSVLGGFFGTVTFNDVADFGPGVLQPSIGIYGLYRITSYPPYADVQPGQTVAGGNLVITENSGYSGFGAGKVSWKADGSALAYGMRGASGITQIPANPPYGSIGVDLPVVEKASPSLVAWGPTPATKDQYLYLSGMDVIKENVGGIYLNTVGDASGGTQLVMIPDYSGQIAHDIEWLPDGSGFLFTLEFTQFPPDPPGMYSDIFEYNFASQVITRLTSLRYDSDAGGAERLSISPDGQQIVFERAFFDPLNPSPSLWIMNRDGTNMHELADDAGSPAWGRTPPVPAPTITSLNPSSAAVGGPAFTLTVNGTGFVSGSVVRWNGSNRATTYVNSTRLTASIPAADIATAGSASVTVFNPAPGGGTSNAAAFGAVNYHHFIYLPAILR